MSTIVSPILEFPRPRPGRFSGQARSRPRRGFTLIELVVATVIAAILASAATVSIRRLADSRDHSRARQAAVESVHAVARRIANDMANIVRDAELRETLVRIEPSTFLSGERRDELLVLSRGLRPVRPEMFNDPDYREGPVHEVQYRLRFDSDVWGIVWRRCDPARDENLEGGGVAVPLAMHIVSLAFEGFDGLNWVGRWDSDDDGYPHALRVTVEGIVPETGARIFARSSVALDRVPPPFDPEHDEDYDPAQDMMHLLGGPGGSFFGGEEGGGTRQQPAPRQGGGPASGGGRRGGGDQ